MRRDEANALLNRMREGQTFEYGQITAALIATGDLDRAMAAGMRSQGLDQALQIANQGTGPTSSGRLVAADEGNHNENSWPGWSKYLDYRDEQGTE
jgi:hypothetical protein